MCFPTNQNPCDTPAIKLLSLNIIDLASNVLMKFNKRIRNAKMQYKIMKTFTVRRVNNKII